MGDKAIWLTLLSAGGLWLLVRTISMVNAVLQLRRMRFRGGDSRMVERGERPEELAAVLDPVGEALQERGFAYEKTVRGPAMLRSGEPEDVWIDVWRHDGLATRAAIRCSEAPEPGLLAAVVFYSRCAGQLLRTENRLAHLQLPFPPDWHNQDALAASLDEHLQYHCRRLPAAGADPLSDEASPESQATLLAWWQESGIAEERADGWQLGWRAAWRFLKQILAGQKRMLTLPPMQGVESAALRQRADARAWAHQERLLAALAMPWRGKLAAFLFSLALGLAAFAWMDSLRFALILLGVLLFHEFGHALAMWLLGYRQLGVLVLPFLGAVAIGRKDDAGPWQKLFVLLAGPLPGLLLGFLCLYLSIDYIEHRDWLRELGGILVGLNYFNLLPFAPLDGGQILETFLFARRPRLRLAFHAFGALGLGALGYFLDSGILIGLGVFLAAFLPFMWRRTAMLRGLPASGGDPVAQLLAQIHALPGPLSASLTQRMQSLRLFLPWLRGRAPRWQESLIGVGIYVLVWVAPVIAVVGLPASHKNLDRWVKSGLSSIFNASPDWSVRLARAQTPGERWQVHYTAGKWFEYEGDDDEQALLHFRAAWAEAQKLPEQGEGLLHRLDSRIALIRVEDGADRAAQYRELLPALRALPSGEKERLAVVLESLSYSGDSTQREASLREAIAVRMALAGQERKYWLNVDRQTLARLVDARGDATEAESLLQASVADEQPAPPWLAENYAWFLLAHERPLEAKKWLDGALTAGKSFELHSDALPWAYLALQRDNEARLLLAAKLAQNRKAAWRQEEQRLELMLDLVRANAVFPEEEKRWLDEIGKFRAAHHEDFLDVRRGVAYEAKGRQWESLRGRARLAVLDRLPDADADRRQAEAGRNSCRQ